MLDMGLGIENGTWSKKSEVRRQQVTRHYTLRGEVEIRQQTIRIVILVPHTVRDRLLRESTLHWIPAFAGMTVFLIILLNSGF